MKKKPAYKMQSVSFRNIDEFLDYLPDEELKITQELREIILDCIPGVKEKLSYNVPFYKKQSGICFLWPSSVLWGKKQAWKGVRLGFNKGYLMHDEINYLDKGERKQVYYHDFHSLKEINFDLVRSYIFDAAVLDKENKKK